MTDLARESTGAAEVTPDRWTCPACGWQVARTHVKRHLAAHDRLLAAHGGPDPLTIPHASGRIGVPAPAREETNRMWLAFLKEEGHGV